MSGIFQKFVTDESGNVQSGASVEVRRSSDNGLVQIFADSAGAVTKDNPFLTLSDGLAEFYCAPQKITVTIAFGLDQVIVRDYWVADSMAAKDAADYPTTSTTDFLQSQVDDLDMQTQITSQELAALDSAAAKKAAANTFTQPQTISGASSAVLNLAAGAANGSMSLFQDGLINFIANGLLLNGAPIGGSGVITDINSANDLPTPSGGYHPLEAGKTYRFNGNISSSSGLEIPADVALVGAGTIYRDAFTYTGTGSAIKATGSLIDMSNMSVYAANGTLFEKTAPGNWVVRRAILSGKNFGTVNASSIFLLDSCQCSFAGTGIEIGAAQPLPFLVMNLCVFANSTTIDPLLDLTGASVGYAIVNDNAWIPKNDLSAPCIKADAASVNIADKFVCNGNFFKVNPGHNPLSGVTVADIKYSFKDNENLSESQIKANSYLTGNALATALTQNVPALITGSWVGDANNQRFNVDASGRVTFIGEGTALVLISITGTVTNAGTGNATFRFEVQKNLTTYLPQRVDVTASANATRTVALQTQVQMSTGDFIDPRITNITTNDDALVANMQVVCRG